MNPPDGKTTFCRYVQNGQKIRALCDYKASYPITDQDLGTKRSSPHHQARGVLEIQEEKVLITWVHGTAVPVYRDEEGRFYYFTDAAGNLLLSSEREVPDGLSCDRLA